MELSLSSRIITFMRAAAVIIATILIKNLFDNKDLSWIYLVTTIIAVGSVLFVGNELICLYQIKYRERHDSDRIFCGLWLNYRNNDANKYGIYRIAFEPSGLQIEGRVYDAATNDWVSSWSSRAVVRSKEINSLAYLYSGESEKNDDRRGDNCFGFCRLVFSSTQGFSGGMGYFVDDTHRTSKQNNGVSSSDLRTAVNTTFRKVTSDFLTEIGFPKKEANRRWFKSTTNWDEYKTLANIYHQYRISVQDRIAPGFGS